MMITIEQADTSCFAQYDTIPMRVRVEREYRLIKPDNGLGGITFSETPIEPYIKDFCVGKDESVTSWAHWDLSHWGFFMAFDAEKPVGAAAVATRTDGVNMLCRREDLAVLWDIRVANDYKHQGVGSALFHAAVEWAKAQGMTQMKIECQNNNIPAVKFYHKQGAILGSVDEYAYYNNPYAKGEVQFIWYLDI
jgi:ribosomal protein S18 acetylase RimI-like enzyme